MATQVDEGSVDRSRNQNSNAVAEKTPGKLSAVHTRGESITRIGRAADNDLVVGDLLVSRHHAEILRDDQNCFVLRDMGSHNGTFMNGRRIQQEILSENDLVSVGRHQFRFTGHQLEEYVDTGRVRFEALQLSVVTSEDQILVNEVSFSLEECNLLAVVGPSGAGKSTLLSGLTGFAPATSGSVLYAGRDLYESYDDLRKRIGYVPQEDVIHTQLKLRDALDYTAELRFPPDVSAAERDARVSEVIRELGLEGRETLQVGKLSGGQRKRASIALELLTKPSLLFLDEPTSGLDHGLEKSVMGLLRDLADQGRTVVVVTHSLQSLDVCDRVLFLALGGSVAYFGPPQSAAGYFGHEDPADIFGDLDVDRSADWKGRFQKHADYRKNVGTPGSEQQGSPKGNPEQPHPPVKSGSLARQFSILTRRYLSVILSDHRNLVILLLQAPILGLLILGISPSMSFAADAGARGNDAAMITLMIVLSATLMGAANAIREVVKELPIYLRERAVGLSLLPYIGSKAAVLSILTLVQAFVVVTIALIGQGGPQRSVFVNVPFLEFYVAIGLAGLGAMALALMVSAMVTSSDRALTLLPLLLIPQIHFWDRLFRSMIALACAN